MAKLLVKILSICAIVAVVYFGNKMLQTHLGENAINELSFTIHSLEEAKEIAAQNGKLVLADYSAIWCPTCRKLDQEVFANDEVATSISQNFVYARLDYDSESGRAFAKKHDLVGFPRVLVLNKDGDKLVEMPLTFNANEYKDNLTKAQLRLNPFNQ